MNQLTFAQRSKELIHAVFFLLMVSGCAALFGWDIHAPGILSQDYFSIIPPEPQRMALYLPSGITRYESTDRGGRFADPQIYHVGEAFKPMIIEGFQQGFDEFVYMETEPTPAIMKRYGIPFVAAVEIRDFHNRVTMKGQALQLVTRISVYDQELNLVEAFEVSGTSDAEKIFSKKGGPEVNLNAAIERNIIATVQHMRDSIRTGTWQQRK